MIDCLVCRTCSISSRENASAMFIWAGRTFYQTLIVHMVKLNGKSMRKTAERSLNKLKSSRFRKKMLRRGYAASVAAAALDSSLS